MAIADRLAALITRSMRRLGGAARPVTLRSITTTGGDSVIGIRGTQTIVDTVVDPTPFVTNVSFQEIQISAGRLHDGDFSVLIPPTGYTKAFIESCVIIVDGVECDPVKVEEWAVENQVVWIRVLATRKHKVGHLST